MEREKPFEVREPILFENHGQKIFGVIHRPLTSEKVPMVLMCHGFGGHKSGQYRVYVELAERLAQSGIASFRFDFRGSGDSEGSLKKMTLEGEISDALKALELITQDATVNQEAIGLFGRSLGGAIAINAAARTGMARTIAAWAPVFGGAQWKELWIQAQDPTIPMSVKQKLLRFNKHEVNLGFLKEFFLMDMEKVLEKISSVPFLNIHGEKDQIIDVSHAKSFSQAREKAPAETEILFYENSDHSFSNTEERQIALDKTVSWFQKTLGRV